LNCDLTFWLDAHISSDLASYLGSQFKIIVKSTQEIDLHEAKDHVRLILSTTFAMAIDRLMAGAPIVEISR
jgi:hypothetical protein